MFCEFPDGSIGGFPAWMIDPRRAVDFTCGTSMASASALTELLATVTRLAFSARSRYGSFEGGAIE